MFQTPTIPSHVIFFWRCGEIRFEKSRTRGCARTKGLTMKVLAGRAGLALATKPEIHRWRLKVGDVIRRHSCARKSLQPSYRPKCAGRGGRPYCALHRANQREITVEASGLIKKDRDVDRQQTAHGVRPGFAWSANRFCGLIQGSRGRVLAQGSTGNSFEWKYSRNSPHNQQWHMNRLLISHPFPRKMYRRWRRQPESISVHDIRGEPISKRIRSCDSDETARRLLRMVNY